MILQHHILNHKAYQEEIASLETNVAVELISNIAQAAMLNYQKAQTDVSQQK